MMHTSHDIPLRLEELLIDRAVTGLDPAEVDELANLLRDHPQVDATAYDYLAAAAAVSTIDDEITEPMPAGLMDRLEADAERWRDSSPVGAIPIERGRPTGAGWGSILPWGLAAACLVIAVWGWMSGSEPQAIAVSDARAMLIDRGATLYPWADNDNGVGGDIVWDNHAQQGYMRFRDLAPNDPTSIQYQLWIFDKQRNEQFNAVDGGVFDVSDAVVDPQTGDAIIPINAKLEVFEPALFAVTTEPPGGVVKHDPQRDPEKYRIILTAAAE